VRLLTKIALGLAAYEGAHAFARFADRRSTFAAAQQRAKELDLPLVVVGDPDAGLHTRLWRAYDCGDLCIDLNSCPACSKTIGLDLTKESIPVATGGAVVFESCVLEYVDDLPAAWAELKRVAGGNENLFTVRVSPWSFTSRLFAGAKWVLEEAPAGSGQRFLARRISDDPRSGAAFLGLPA